jgi:hypothetical protein
MLLAIFLGFKLLAETQVVLKIKLIVLSQSIDIFLFKTHLF